MTKKLKLTHARRDVIREFGLKHIAASIDRTKEQQHLGVLIDATNAAIRAKYPEADLVVLRTYNLERIDRCLKFQFPNGRVDGFSFATDAVIADIPYDRTCYYGSSKAFPVTAAFEEALDEYARLKADSDKQQQEKEREFRAFLGACRSLDEVTDVVPLPADILTRLGHESTALVAVTPETVQSLKATFTKAA